jgi:octaprenyl-diphosphate synthase
MTPSVATAAKSGMTVSNSTVAGRVGSSGTSSAAAAAVTEPAETLRETLFGAIGADLQRVESRLREELRSDHPYVDELVRYGCLLGGKRLRPALLLLAAKACGGVRDEHLTLATVVEMIHTATLVHDDVIDESGMRRHLATVNARWDNEASVLLGDFLFTHAFYLASTLPTTHACRLIGHATNIVCEGELRQKGLRGRFDLDPAEYFAVVEAKTAELCSVSCELGAFYAGASPEVAEALSLYGRDLGIAFQIADDLLDFQGDEETMGKSLGTDLQKQRPTLPVIHLLERASGRDRSDALAALRGEIDEPLPVLRALLLKHGSFEHTLAVASSHAQRAVSRLSGLAASVARDTLGELARFVVQRRR